METPALPRAERVGAPRGSARSLAAFDSFPPSLWRAEFLNLDCTPEQVEREILKAAGIARMALPPGVDHSKLVRFWT